MTIKEAKAMVGTEFTYILPDGDRVRAYVKAFDPKIGLTCSSLDTKTEQGYKFPYSAREEDGTVCLIGINFKRHPKESALSRLKEIQETGTCKAQGKGNGIPSCAFL
jgi:hypothetical protein